MTPEPTAEAVEFLRCLAPDEPAHLVAMPPDNRPVCRTFDPIDFAKVRDWIEGKMGAENIYYHVNVLKDGVRDKKATKADIEHARCLHADVDDLNALDRIRSFSPPPSVVVASGGGYQALWLLKEPSFDLDRVERCNRALEQALGADHCHNVDRILRLPGTINVPNAKKRAAGRVAVPARVVEANWDLRYDLADFKEASPPTAAAATSSVEVVPIGPEDLPGALTAYEKVLIATGDDPVRPRGSENARYPSRSEAVFRVACALAREGWEEARIAGVLINPVFGISQSILEKRNPNRYSVKQARDAIAAVGDGWPDVDKSINPRPTFRNTLVACQRLEIRFAFNQFKSRKTLSGYELEEHQGEISDDAVLAIRGLILKRFGFDPRSDNVRDAVNFLCIENAYHPVREEIDRLTWDGVPRLDTWLTTYLGAEETPLNRAIGAILLIAAVRRIRKPGTKFDQIVVLEGPQGSGKSTAVRILAGEGNHSDQEIINLDAKAQMEMMEGVWFYELGELDGLNKAEANRIKAFASRTVDRARPAYGHYSVARPRQAVFVGTTNEEKYLRDPTGNRRFWPVMTSAIDLEALARDRDQLIAEAASREAAGESIVLPTELWAQATAEQAARTEDDPWMDAVENARPQVVDGMLRHFTTNLLANILDIRPDQQNQGHTKRLAVLMKKLGWKPVRLRQGGRVIRGYEKPRPDGYVLPPKTPESF
ncbi:VapE domain-containing protein [Chthonobacter albigriseus]|uniref:VapE domain-containing protein n=1 Tax=Chthonobacter albigriseus TaxID=1683161 RepID=UPI0015EEFCD4|nr:VapE domain-containing protein [Chthonobacter albigriseus]